MIATIAHRAKLIALLALAFGIGAMNDSTGAEYSDGQLPMRTVTITLDEGTRSQFFDQLKKFSDSYAFAIRIAPTRPDIPRFLIQMWREDVKAIGTNSLGDLQFRIGFYKNDAHPPETAAINQIVSGLKQAVEKVPGAAVSEER